MSGLSRNETGWLPEFWAPEARAGALAWAQGREACDNPHSVSQEPERHDAWRDGWRAARDEWAVMDVQRQKLKALLEGCGAGVWDIQEALER